MSIEVQSFDDFESLQQIEAQQSNLIRVILEGRDDVALFAHQWFVAEQETFDFIEAGRIVAGSGCAAVFNAVNHSLDADRVPAIGIVDRDVLFRASNWQVLYEKEHDRFAEATHSEKVHVASLWEIEAYLLDPELLRNVVRACARNAPAEPGQMDTALQRTLGECATLLDIAPYLAGKHSAGVTVPTGYLCNLDTQQIQTEVDRQLSTFAPPSNQVAMQVQGLVMQIKAELPQAPGEQLSFYLRYIDTKRLLQRLVHTLELRNFTKWLLAGLQASTGRRPYELEQVLERAKQRFFIH